MTIVMPEAWENHNYMKEDTKNYYKYCASIMEPWDGPALVTFCNGKSLGAMLDRNGLRPCRFYITTEDKLILGSEVGTLPLNPNEIKFKGRLEPGNLFYVDFENKKIINDYELKKQISTEHPYGEWLSNHVVELPKSSDEEEQISPRIKKNMMEDPRLKIFGYSVEHIEILLKPLCLDGVEPLGSMGNDSALAVMDSQPRLLYSYFKQLFAQVTNPAIDSIRESIVMSLNSFIGPQGNILKFQAEHCHRLYLEHPFLTIGDCKKIKHINEWHSSWKSIVLNMTFDINKTLREGVFELCQEAEKIARSNEYQFIILSDKNSSISHSPMGSLIACGAVHHHLVKQKLRSKVAIIIESGDARKAHHFCTLLGYGADAICPYLAIEILFHLQQKGEIPYDTKKILANYFSGLQKGTKKIMAKMGISTLQSYKGSQIFEALGLNSDVIDHCFVGTPSRVQGIGFNELEKHALWRHSIAFDKSSRVIYRGDYHWRSGGSVHAYTPQSISSVQIASKLNDKQKYIEYAAISNQMTERCMLRGMLNFKLAEHPTPLDEVEPASEIVKRFATGAMSYGSLSKETHETLAIAMNRIGAVSNCGEGGENPDRWLKTYANGDSKRSAVKQVATGRFGVTSNYLANCDQLQIKICQGAKPGEGGELVGSKVTKGIAKTRRTTPGVGLISPPPHHDIYSIEDLKQLIFDLKNSNPDATVSVKLASEVGIGVIAAGVVKARADHIVISGHEGGTGAARWTSIKHAGLPWELGIAETHQTLVLNNLRQYVRLQTDGCLRTGKDVVYAALLGAEEFGFGTIPLITLGCIMMRKCHLNTCPVGIATQDPILRKKFEGKPEHLVNFFFMLAEEVRSFISQLGFHSLDEIIGRVDLLSPRETRDDDEFPIHQFDFTSILTPAFQLRPNVPTKFVARYPSELSDVLDQKFIKKLKENNFFEQLNSASDSSDSPRFISIIDRVSNVNRSVGTLLSYHISKLFGENAIPDHSIQIQLSGSAGQSFGAFLRSGITLRLLGDANDYVGKGLSGGILIIHPDDNQNNENNENNNNTLSNNHSSFKENKKQFKTSLDEIGIHSYSFSQALIGNTVLYGATSGFAFFAGCASERFAVRNSGVKTVVEGVGDHACEYMTGGRVVILGSCGRNFAAGMSGGIAWIYNPFVSNFEKKCNLQMVDIESLSNEEDLEEPLQLIQLHYKYTNSPIAKKILSRSKHELISKFTRIMPKDYKPIWEKECKELKEAQKQQQQQQQQQEEISKNSSNVKNNNLDHSTDDKKEKSLLTVKNEAILSNNKDIIEKAAIIADIEDLPVGKLDKIHGFKKYSRKAEKYRPVEERIKDWDEIWTSHSHSERVKQASRCMDCGIPFCQSDSGCPIHNKIPEWNDLVYKGKWKQAYERLSETNNFPEFTGRVCPAPCEGSCVLAITDQSVTIKNIENSIINHAFTQGWVKPRIPKQRSDKKIAIIGSGPTGLTAADQLNQMGYNVVVFERDPEIGGLLRYGVPQVKLSKKIVQRRIDILAAEGIVFKANTNIQSQNDFLQLKKQFDCVLFATGSTKPRDMNLPGRENTKGVHFAMDYLRSSQQYLDGHVDHLEIDAKDKNVIVIGAGDTGCDCISTAVRQQCKSILNFNFSYQPPSSRDGLANPWPQYPKVFTVEYGHSEASHHMSGKEPRRYNVKTKAFLSDENGHLTGIETSSVVWKQRPGTIGRSGMDIIDKADSTFVYPADLVLIAIGYSGVDENFGIRTINGNTFDAPFYHTDMKGVFAAGDCRRGQSLIVWAIREGREAAEEIHSYLQTLKN